MDIYNAIAYIGAVLLISMTMYMILKINRILSES
jgi:hypothetical protein